MRTLLIPGRSVFEHLYPGEIVQPSTICGPHSTEFAIVFPRRPDDGVCYDAAPRNHDRLRVEGPYVRPPGFIRCVRNGAAGLDLRDDRPQQPVAWHWWRADARLCRCGWYRGGELAQDLATALACSSAPGAERSSVDRPGSSDVIGDRIEMGQGLAGIVDGEVPVDGHGFAVAG